MPLHIALARHPAWPAGKSSWRAGYCPDPAVRRGKNPPHDCPAAPAGAAIEKPLHGCFLVSVQALPGIFCGAFALLIVLPQLRLRRGAAGLRRFQGGLKGFLIG